MHLEIAGAGKGRGELELVLGRARTGKILEEFRVGVEAREG